MQAREDKKKKKKSKLRKKNQKKLAKATHTCNSSTNKAKNQKTALLICPFLFFFARAAFFSL
jgi:predicted ribosome quality control (RQC) complex YloA/Tae2 family protein